VESETAPRVEQYLSKIKVIRRIAHKIIDFLAQLEEFQKKLWLKKKFVVETSYCIRLGVIPEEFYPEIAANDAQREEWVRLCAIDEIKGDLTTPEYSVPLTVEFLKAHPTLMVDTRHFGDDFTSRLLDRVEAPHERTDGLLVHSENFQALSLMRTTFRKRVHAIYIDPPYNTNASAIDYKNGYKTSSWMSLIEGRLSLSKDFLAENGVLVAAIDDEQQRELSFILSDVFDGQILGTIVVRSNPSGRPTQTGYAVSHEYLLFAGIDGGSSIRRLPPTDEQAARFSERDKAGPFEWRNLRREGANSDRAARPALFFPIYIYGTSIRIPKMSWNDDAEEWVIEEAPQPDEEVVWPTNETGQEKTWRWEWKTIMSSLDQLSVRKDRSGRNYVYYKRRPHEEGVVSVSSWFDAKYSATEHGTAVIKALFGRPVFSYPKSIHAVRDALIVSGARDLGSIVFDYFAGSGTTGHAVIDLNRSDAGLRKFILVEQADYFDTVLLPRLKKVTFTPEWKDGKPKRLATSEEAERSPRIMKVIRLESYEDTLNNLELRRTEAQQSLLDSPQAQGADGFREQYLLRYMLDVETRGSQSLLNVSAFMDPTAYKLKVKRPGSDESREVNVDLLETFNWLIGLKVDHIAAPRTFSAAFRRDADPDLPADAPRRLLLDGLLKEDPEGLWWFRTVIGTTPDGRRTLVIWRKRPGGEDPEGIERDNLVLDEWFRKQGYSSKDSEFDLIYVNGDNNLENLKAPDETWKVRLIEEDFFRLMFEMEGV
jgi:adenine-specific DNA-methyltransferase